MTANEIVEELKSLGSDATKKVLVKHGAKEPFSLLPTKVGAL